MKNRYWTAIAIAVFTLPFAAEVQFGQTKSQAATLQAQQDPLSLPWVQYAQAAPGFNSSVRPRSPSTTAQATPAPVAPPAPALAPVVNVQPPVVNVAPGPAPVVNVAAPNVNLSPQLALPEPTGLEQIRAWLSPILLAVGTAIVGKIAFFGIKATPAAPGSGGIPNLDGLLKLKEKFTDEGTRSAIDAMALRVVQTGLLGTAAQAGLGFVPGAGPFLSAGAKSVDPFVKAQIEEYLAARIAGRGGVAVVEAVAPAVPSAPTASNPDLINVLSGLKDLPTVIGGLRDMINQRLPPHA